MEVYNVSLVYSFFLTQVVVWVGKNNEKVALMTKLKAKVFIEP